MTDEYTPTTDEVREQFAGVNYYSAHPTDRDYDEDARQAAAFDRWLAEHDKAASTRITELEVDPDRLRGVLLNVLCNASNYPPPAQPWILGRDMGPLIERAVYEVMLYLREEKNNG